MTRQIKMMFALCCAVFAIAACGSMDQRYHAMTGEPRPSGFAPSCSLDEIAYVNAVYTDQYEQLASALRNRLFSETVAPQTRSDIYRAEKYQSMMIELKRDIDSRYGTARTSCAAFLECERVYGAQKSTNVCEAKRGAMLIADSELRAMGGELTRRAVEVQSYAPFEAVPVDRPGYDKSWKDKPTVNRKETCPTVSDIFTLCSYD